jgi:hypothetical protein
MPRVLALLVVCFCREQDCSARAVAPHKINCFMLVVGLRGNKRGSFSHDQVLRGFYYFRSDAVCYAFAPVIFHPLYSVLIIRSRDTKHPTGSGKRMLCFSALQDGSNFADE